MCLAHVWIIKFYQMFGSEGSYVQLLFFHIRSFILLVFTFVGSVIFDAHIIYSHGFFLHSIFSCLTFTQTVFQEMFWVFAMMEIPSEIFRFSFNKFRMEKFWSHLFLCTQMSTQLVLCYAWLKLLLLFLS